MKPKKKFAACIERAEHFLMLYELLCNTRRKDTYSNWQFSRPNHWKTGDGFVRIDGKNKDSILIIRGTLGITREKFCHDNLSGLLAAAVVFAVSALDRYVHDQIVENSWKLLNRAERDIPKDLSRLRVPLLATKKAVERLKRASNSRPGFIVKQEIQEVLHREYTFQKSNPLKSAGDILGIKDFWGSLAEAHSDKLSKSDLIAKLDAIAERRNQIVHEADTVLTIKDSQIQTHDITKVIAKDYIDFIEKTVSALDKVIENQCV